MNQLHPSYRLLCWLTVVVSIQCLSGSQMILAMLVLPVLGKRVLMHALKLIRRARWLLFSLLAVLAWGLPGEAIWESGGGLSPTYEGLQAGSEQVVRLALVLCALATLLETTPITQLMAGCYALFQPLRHVGLCVDSAVLRLSLALHYADQQPAGGWKQMLQPSIPRGPGNICFSIPAVRWADRIALIFAGLVLAWVVFS